MRPGSPQRDPHLEALMDAERSSLERPEDPHMAALMGEDVAHDVDPYQELPQGYAPQGSTHRGPALDRYLSRDRELEEADVASGYEGVRSPDEVDASGLPALYRDAQREALLKGTQMRGMFGGGPDPERDRFIEQNVPEAHAGDEALTARMLDEYRRTGGRR